MSRSHAVSVLDPQQRLDYGGDITAFIERAAEAFQLGKPHQVAHLPDGYEDCNIQLETSLGKFVLKLFASQQLGNPLRSRRGPDVAERLVDVIRAASSAGMTTPRLAGVDDGTSVFRFDGLAAVAYDWIEGETFMHLGRGPTRVELEAIVQEASRLHRSAFRPQHYNDIWAVPNFSSLRALVYPYLDKDDRLLVDQVKRRFEHVPLDALPRCLVHGDLTKGNVIVAPRGRPRIIDFSIANHTPRVLELVVIACNLTFDDEQKVPLLDRIESVTSTYETHARLTSIERDSLPDLCLVGCAMELLGGRWRQALLGDASAETEYWVTLGRRSLQRALA